MRTRVFSIAIIVPIRREVRGARHFDRQISGDRQGSAMAGSFCGRFGGRDCHGSSGRRRSLKEQKALVVETTVQRSCASAISLEEHSGP